MRSNINTTKANHPIRKYLLSKYVIANSLGSIKANALTKLEVENGEMTDQKLS